MALYQSINVLFAPLAMLSLIAVDYSRINSTDQFQRRVFMLTILLTSIAIFSDMGYDATAGLEGPVAHRWVDAFCFLYYAFQVAAYHSVNLFVDYCINKNSERTRKLGIILGVIQLVHIGALLLNFAYPFYYVISEDNYYFSGPLYIIRLLFSYSAAAIGFISVGIARNSVRWREVALIVVTLLLTSIGSTLDLLVPGIRLVWPCFCTSLLFCYFFIIRRDSFSDPLTGVDNRRSCDEYLRNIGHLKRRYNYGFIMIDLDKFKHINDTFGHAQGDLALRDAAQLIRKCVRRTDFVTRYGGDEFLVICPSIENIGKFVDRLQADLSAFNRQGIRPYELLMSIGYDMYTLECEQTPQEFVAHVDALMYQKKKRRSSDHTPA